MRSTLDANEDLSHGLLLISGNGTYSQSLSMKAQQGNPVFFIYNDRCWTSFKNNPQWLGASDYLALPSLQYLKFLSENRRKTKKIVSQQRLSSQDSSKQANKRA